MFKDTFRAGTNKVRLKQLLSVILPEVELVKVWVSAVTGISNANSSMQRIEQSLLGNLHADPSTADHHAAEHDSMDLHFIPHTSIAKIPEINPVTGRACALRPSHADSA